MPTLNAKKFLNRHDAEHAGQETGQQYALVIIIVLLYMSYSGMLPFCHFTTALLALAIFVAFRTGFEYYMGCRWDHHQSKRERLQNEGMDAVQAFEAVRDGQA